MKKINFLLAGYFGFNNAGDELILKYLIENIRTLKPDSNITVLSKNPSQTKKKYLVSAIDRWNPLKVYITVQHSDVVIFSGGLFQDTTSSLSLYYYLALIILAKLLNKKVYLCGVDFNFLKSNINFFFLKKIINLVDKINVRTFSSYNLSKKYINHSKVNLTADIVFSSPITPCHSSPTSSTDKESQNNTYKIGIIFRAPYKKEEWHTQKIEINEFCKVCLKEIKNIRFDFIAFHPERDIKFIFELNTNILKWRTIEELIDLLKKFDLIITQRLHGIILSILLKKPFMAISKDIKIISFIKEINFKDFLVESFNDQKLIFLMKEFLEQSHNVTQLSQIKTIGDISVLKQDLWARSRKNFLFYF